MSLPFLVGLVLSAAIGLSLGLIGGGGSIITVPVLVYALGVPPREAVAMSLAVVGSTSLVGVALHHRRGVVRFRAGGLFAAAGVVTAYLGSRLTSLVSGPALLLIFGVLMLVVATLMLLRRAGGYRGTEGEAHPVKAGLAGATVGVLTGFLGVGGGFLIVPALVLFGGLAMHEAVGTSLLVIAVNCAAGLLGHLHGGGFDGRLTAIVTALALLGTWAGAGLSHHLSAEGLRRGFALFVIAVGLYLILRNAPLVAG